MKRFLPLLLLLLTGCGSDPVPERSFSHAAYVWNYQWTGAVTSSVARAKTLGLDRLDVFCGELGGSGHAAPDWTAAARAGLPVVPVLRVFARRSGDIETRPEALAADVSKTLLAALAAARAAGCTTAGAQLDLDCPERLLDAYADWLPTLRAEIPGEPLGVTVLPCHTGHTKAFRRLADAVDEFVLQVHGTRFPQHLAEPAHLVWEGEAGEAIRKAGRVGRPFRIALPSYAFTLVFDRAGGRMRGLRFPDDPPPGADGVERRLAPDVGVITRLMEEARRAEHCLGIAWFRLPVAGDPCAWDPGFFADVIAGRSPRPELRAGFTVLPDGRHELWVFNRGVIDAREAAVTITWPETLGDYWLARPTLDHMPGVLPTTFRIPLPPPGARCIPAWFRPSRPAAGVHALPITS
jgi:hypothetical protein